MGPLGFWAEAMLQAATASIDRRGHITVTFEDGTTRDLSAAESKECQHMDEQSLQTLENMVHFNDLKDAVLVQAEVLFFSSADTGLTAVLSLLAFCAAA